MAVLEQGVVDVDEPLGLGVAHGDRRLQREQAGVGLGPLPHRGLALGDVGLAERERQERHVPVGAGAQAGDHVVVGDAGVRAAVVVGQSEAAGHGGVNEVTGQSIPRPAQDSRGRRARARRRWPSRRRRRTRGGCGRRPGWSRPTAASLHHSGARAAAVPPGEQRSP